MKSNKRSIAMKKSWARRRNSPMRVQARKRQAAKVAARIARNDAKFRAAKVMPNIKTLLERLDVVAAANINLHNRLNHVESNAQEGIRGLRAKMLAKPIGPPHVRRAIATHMLAGMLSSIPITDRTKVKADVWATKAYEFADALIAAEGT